HDDPADARASLSAAVSLILRLLKRNPDAATSRDHVLLTLLAERRMVAGLPADLSTLIRDVLEPPMERLGSLTVDEYMPLKQRQELAATLNTLLASPAFKAWREGVPLDVGAWLTPRAGSTSAGAASAESTSAGSTSAESASAESASAGGRPKTPAVIV